jgi:hypothetical protein
MARQSGLRILKNDDARTVKWRFVNDFYRQQWPMKLRPKVHEPIKKTVKWHGSLLHMMATWRFVSFQQFFSWNKRSRVISKLAIHSFGGVQY